MEPHGAGKGSSYCDNDTKSPEDKATKHPRLTYSGKMILAPMVKIGTTPMRLLALHYGAGKAFTCTVMLLSTYVLFVLSFTKESGHISSFLLHISGDLCYTRP